MHTAKQVLVYQENAEGKIVIRLYKAPILVADGLQNPSNHLSFSPIDAGRAVWRLLVAILRVWLHDLDPSPEISPADGIIPTGIKPVNVSLMMRNLYAKVGIPFNPRMPLVAQKWRIAEELRKDCQRCDEPLKAGLERLVEQLEEGDFDEAKRLEDEQKR